MLSIKIPRILQNDYSCKKRMSWSYFIWIWEQYEIHNISFLIQNIKKQTWDSEDTPGTPIFLFKLKCTAISGSNVNKHRQHFVNFALWGEQRLLE